MRSKLKVVPVGNELSSLNMTAVVLVILYVRRALIKVLPLSIGPRL